MYVQYNKHIHNVNKLCSVCFTCTMFHTMNPSFSMCVLKCKYIHYVNNLSSVCFTCKMFYTMKTIFSICSVCFTCTMFYTLKTIFSMCSVCFTNTMFYTMKSIFSMYFLYSQHIQCTLWKQTVRCVFFMVSIFTM